MERIEIYLAIDECDGDVLCAFTDLEKAKEDCIKTGALVRKTSLCISDVLRLIDELQDFI